MKVGDRASAAVLAACCLGTAAALVLTSTAKKANLTGPPAKPAWLAEQQSVFEKRLKALHGEEEARGRRG